MECAVFSWQENKPSIGRDSSQQLAVSSYQLVVGRVEATNNIQESKLLFFCKIFNNSLSKTF